MNADTAALERRRQVLLVKISLQRFALRGDIGSLRAAVRPSAWQRPLALAAAGIGARWLLASRGPVAGAVGAVGWGALALRFWTALFRR
jgi:hypothetical protein